MRKAYTQNLILLATFFYVGKFVMLGLLGGGVSVESFFVLWFRIQLNKYPSGSSCMLFLAFVHYSYQILQIILLSILSCLALLISN